MAESTAAAAVATLGVAAALACEREQGRWVFLACSPLTASEIILAKWTASWWETWPLWATGITRALLGAAAGALPWSAVPVAAIAAPVAAAAGGALAAAFCVGAPSLTAAQQRAVLLLGAPLLGASAALWLLPHLHSLAYLTPAHLLLSALRFHPGGVGRQAALLGLGAHLCVGGVALGAAVWQLRNRPPV